jgi:hypothetical protein
MTQGNGAAASQHGAVPVFERTSAMTTTLPNLHAPNLASHEQPRLRRFPGWLREPLLHFVAMGGLLFGLDHVLASRSDSPNVIVVGAEVDSEAVETFQSIRGREPNDQERAALHKVWLDNEVLYREGLALKVDAGDPAIRERVIFKALSVIDSNVKVPKIDEQGLRKWFEAHREKYDEPPRFDFEEAALTGDSSEAAVRDFVKQLNSGVPGDAKAGLRVFKGRPLSNIVQSYGQALVDALEHAQVGVWQAMLTKDGWRAIMLDARTPPKPADFAAVQAAVAQDWTDATAAEQRSAAVAALAKKYTIRYETRAESSPE